LECGFSSHKQILGKKKDRVKVVYTPYLNLHKSGDMDIGAVGFHDERKVRIDLIFSQGK